MKIILAQPRGFCAGVERAIEIVERALEVHGAPIYVRHEIVHNKYVVNTLEQNGSIFVNVIDQVRVGSVLVFLAHGDPNHGAESEASRDYVIYPATSPLERTVHAPGAETQGPGYEIIMIGHVGHPEVEGTVGQVDQHVEVVESAEQVENLQLKNPEKVAYVSQTTISCDDSKVVINALKRKYPRVLEPKKADICYATQNRQDAVKELAKRSDLILVVGSKTSSNSNRLREVAEGVGTKAYLLDDASEIDPIWLKGIESIGITAGASAPEILVEEIIERLKEFEPCEVIAMEGVEENVEFPLPKGLWKKDLEEAKSQNKV